MQSGLPSCVEADQNKPIGGTTEDARAADGLFPLDARSTRDLAPLLLDAHGVLEVVPASAMAATTSAQRMLFGVRHGIYGLLTEELIQFLREFIAGRRAIGVVVLFVQIGALSSQAQRHSGFPSTAQVPMSHALPGTEPVHWQPRVLEARHAQLCPAIRRPGGPAVPTE